MEIMYKLDITNKENIYTEFNTNSQRNLFILKDYVYFNYIIISTVFESLYDIITSFFTMI